jgi:hypothetical protein
MALSDDLHRHHNAAASSAKQCNTDVAEVILGSQKTDLFGSRIFRAFKHPKSHLHEVHSSCTDDDAPIDLARKIFHRYHRYCWRPVVWISFVESNALGVRIISPQNMDKTELVTLVSSKTGLNEQMATLAVDTVIGFLKQKLPAELSGQLDSLLSGQESSGGMLGAVKGLFGKKDS